MHQVQGALADDLVGDLRTAGRLGVAGRGNIHAASAAPRRASAALGSDVAFSPAATIATAAPTRRSVVGVVIDDPPQQAYQLFALGGSQRCEQLILDLG